MTEYEDIDVDAIESHLAGQVPEWPIAEYFCSINGEGPRAGRLAVFIRFPGCNLACSYCDTGWANGLPAPGVRMDADELCAYVDAKGANCVTLTGGEPLLQPNLDCLIHRLLEGDAERTVEIETNGALDLAPVVQAREQWGHLRVADVLGDDDGSLLDRINRKNLFEREAGRVGITMDWKLPSSGMEGRMQADNLHFLGSADALKFVVGSQDDLDAAARLIDEKNLAEQTQVFLSPVYGDMDPADIVAFMKDRSMAKVRLQLQLHKIVWPNVEKGV